MSRSSGFSFNLRLLTPIIILVILSLITLFSINIDFFRSQFIYLIISVFCFLFISQIDYKALQIYSFPIYLISIGSLFIVLILGFQSRGAVRWIDIFGLKMQFSEVIKPFLLFSLATYLSNKPRSLKTLLTVLILLVPILFLIYKQPDLGNAIIFLLTTVFTLVFFGFPLIWFILGLLGIIISLPLVWRIMHDYQKQRILSFIYPANDPLGVSYNAIQSVIAVGSGMILGKGFSQGTQSVLKFLPERHTDFIFATISENLGFLGSLTIIVCFAFFLYQLYLIFKRCSEPFSKIFIASSFFLILIQVFVNIGMNTGILPIVGVTLPFVSSGGSSLLSSFILLGLISSVEKSCENDKVLEIK